MSQSETPDPTRIGDYEIEGLLGAGGMAKVYRAKHSILETTHAIKVLDPEYRANAEARKRFLDEAKIQAKHLDHPNIVKVTNIVATAEYAALVMELIEGSNLEGYVGQLKGKPGEIKRIMLGVLDGVGHAHKVGIIHRDLKPANVLLAKRGDEMIPKVTDFGIAKLTVPDDGKGGKKSTHAAARMGTLSYMSPEQIRRAKDVTARSDIFSLGAMLYEMATGEMAFGGESDYDVMENIVNGRFKAPERHFDKVDPSLASIIAKALETDPAARFASCEEMAAALRGEITVAPPKPAATSDAAKPAPAPAPAPKAEPAPAPKPTPTPEPKAVAPAPTMSNQGSSKKGIVLVLVGAGLALGGVAAYLGLKGSGSGSGGGSTGSQGSGSSAVVSQVPQAAIDAAAAGSGSAAVAITPPIVIDAAVAVADIPPPATPVDAGVPVDAAVKAAPPPVPQNPCAGKWSSGSDLSINVTGSVSKCAGTYSFKDTGGTKGTCGGSFGSCKIAGGKTSITFSCNYSDVASGDFDFRRDMLQGSMVMTCSGRSASAKIDLLAGGRTWSLTKR